MKRALITGITGQDGSFMAEYLLNRNYQVYGFARHDSWLKSTLDLQIKKRIQILHGDMSNGVDIATAISNTMPNEIYNLASQSRPGESWTRASETLTINGMGAIQLFEAVRVICPKAKVYHASSSEMFGRTKAAPQNENTAFDPASPYAASKVYAHQMAKIYRESYGLFIACGILFNHESERRPLHFVTQKIAYGAACAALGILNSPAINERGQPIVEQGKLALGNLDISRDWGYAQDFVQAMWSILQQDNPDDFVIGTGRLHTLRELCEIAYQHVGKNWLDHVMSDPALIRPLDANLTVADPSKAARILNWKPSVSFDDMIQKMVQAQIKLLRPLIE
ncbi:MAG: GDP-mannose 4,6-dehydratase [Legionellaceae bacterium]|nr:GDP-mannose 4,6-dehydratase [Legionellaceae bacterium]